MKLLIWGVSTLLALLWTGLVALTVALTGWVLDAVSASGGSMETLGGMTSWPMPPWLALWVDPALVEAMLDSVGQTLAWLAAVLPSGDTLMAWLGPLLWVGWGLGMLVLVGTAVVLHLMAGRLPTRLARG